MSKSLKLTALALGLACAAQAMAADLTVVSFGGANKNAQVKAFYEPFQASTSNTIIAGEYNGEMAKVKAMVDTGSVSWNLVEVESPSWPVAATRGCSRSWTRPSSARRKTSSRGPSSPAASASSSGPPCWPTTPTS